MVLEGEEGSNLKESYNKKTKRLGGLGGVNENIKLLTIPAMLDTFLQHSLDRS